MSHLAPWERQLFADIDATNPAPSTIEPGVTSTGQGGWYGEFNSYQSGDIYASTSTSQTVPAQPFDEGPRRVASLSGLSTYQEYYTGNVGSLGSLQPVVYTERVANSLICHQPTPPPPASLPHRASHGAIPHPRPPRPGPHPYPHSHSHSRSFGHSHAHTYPYGQGSMLPPSAYGPPLASPVAPHHSAYATPMVPGRMSHPSTPTHGSVGLPQGHYHPSTHVAQGDPVMMRGAGRSPHGTSLKRGHACGFCRRRKLKCSGTLPICTNCIKYKKECEYGQPMPAKPVPVDSQVQPSLDSGPSDNSVGMPLQHDTDTDPSANFGDWMTDNLPLDESEWTFDPTQYDTTVPTVDTNSSDTVPQLTSGSAFSSWTDPADFPFFDMKDPGGEVDPLGPVLFAGYRDVQPQESSSEVSPHVADASEALQGAGAGAGAGAPDAQGSLKGKAKRQHTAGLQLDIPTLTIPNDRPIALLSPSSIRTGKPSPDLHGLPPPAVTLVNNTPPPQIWTHEPPQSHKLFVPSLTFADPMEALARQMGEFLFFPTKTEPAEEGDKHKRRRSGTPSPGKKSDVSSPASERAEFMEVDGLTDKERDKLLDHFFPLSRFFFEMSVSRFRYRLTFTDQRRPTLACLYAMYMWGIRFSGVFQPDVEERYFQAACLAIHQPHSRPERLLDQMRAGMLLSTFAFTAGRFHEGWMLHGVAMRLVISTGLHQIPSHVLTPLPPRNKLLRHRGYLLPPPEDRTELGERIHTFWALMGIQRACELATSFPLSISDDDVTTPFARDLADIASGNVSVKDDVTIRDLYVPVEGIVEESKDSGHIKWCKAVILLERAAKMAFTDPEEDSEYARAAKKKENDKDAVIPPHLNQPKYRRPAEFKMMKMAIEQYISSLGEDGEYPVDRYQRLKEEGRVKENESGIPSNTLNVQHISAATQMFLHDVNVENCENQEALVWARRSVAITRDLPELPVADIDSFAVQVWGMVARVLIKEVHRLRALGDEEGARVVEGELKVNLDETRRAGQTMSVAMNQLAALEQLLESD